jgi:hypothetical protein
MKEIFSTTAYGIEARGVAELRIDAHGVLQVESGQVWLTRSGDAADYWLDAGASLAVRAGESLWLSAEAGQPARLAVRHAACRSRRGLAWLGQMAAAPGPARQTRSLADAPERYLASTACGTAQCR